MKKVLINYADKKFESVRRVNTWTGKHIAWFDEVIEYGPEKIDKRFLENHKNILNYERGNGLWLWKPYFVRKALHELEDGDFLFYLDAGAFFVRKISPLIEAMTDDFFVTDLPFIEEQWTKPSVFTTLCPDKEVDSQSNQIQASFIMLRKSKITEDFVDEWLELCCQDDLITPEESGIKDRGFIAHREDQSLFSILCKKRGIQPHKDPSQFGRFPERYFLKQEYVFKIPIHMSDTYQPVVVLHRMEKIKSKSFLKLVLITLLPYRIAKKMNYRKKNKQQ